MTKMINAKTLGDIIRLERDTKEIEKEIKRINRKIFILELKKKWNGFIGKNDIELDEYTELLKKHIKFNRSYLQNMEKYLIEKLA